MLKGFAEAQKAGMKMRQGEVQPDSVIQALHPYFQPVVRAFNDTTRVHLERLRREAKNRMMPTPNVSGDQLLQSIASQHPGKVVFFDLWATWCGPCMKGIQAMEPMKEQLKDQDVVFVYLTNESSPIDQWSEQVIRIPGLHYRIPNILWSEIPGLDGGIPQYYIYNSQGHRIWEQTGFGNNTLEVIAEEIEKIIK
jgi:thiol-disulfide isomerase/thioredoxin